MAALASSLIRQKRAVKDDQTNRPVANKRKPCPKSNKSLCQKQILVLISKVRLCGGRKGRNEKRPGKSLVLFSSFSACSFSHSCVAIVGWKLNKSMFHFYEITKKMSKWVLHFYIELNTKVICILKFSSTFFISGFEILCILFQHRVSFCPWSNGIFFCSVTKIFFVPFDVQTKWHLKPYILKFIHSKKLSI